MSGQTAVYIAAGVLVACTVLIVAMVVRMLWRRSISAGQFVVVGFLFVLALGAFVLGAA